jgi:RNA polymerase sigma-70 factor (ECF subfamily)
MGILGTMAAADDTQEQPVVRAEDTPSLEALYAAHAASLTRVLHAAGFPDPADAVQEAFVQAVVHWRKVSRYDDPVAWIRRVAINRGLNKRRSRRRRDALTERIAATSTASALYGFDPADHDGDLADLIVTLPPQQRLALTLFYFADLPVAEVAHAMQLSEGTVKFHLHAARTALARALETTASESGDDA